MISKTYLIADTHFNHKRIIEYCKRPYSNVEEMNEDLIRKWNNVVSKNDIVIHVGDFGFGSFDELKDIFDRLNGNKYLVMGNHDLRAGYNFYKELGFIAVFKKEMLLKNIVISHKPKDIPDDFINIYGHIHNADVPSEFNDKKHFCVSVEKINYLPIELETLLGVK